MSLFLRILVHFGLGLLWAKGAELLDLHEPRLWIYWGLVLATYVIARFIEAFEKDRK